MFLNLSRGWIIRIINTAVQQATLILRAPTAYVDTLDEKTTDGGITLAAAKINLSNLPTSDSELAAGDLWSDGGVITIVS